MTSEEINKKIYKDLTISYIEKNDDDCNSRPYPYGSFFTVEYTDGTKSTKTNLCVRTEVEVNGKKKYKYDRYVGWYIQIPYVDEDREKRYREVEINEDIVNEILSVADDKLAMKYIEINNYTKVVVQHFENRTDPYTFVIGDEKKVEELLREKFSQHTVECYEIFSGGGFEHVYEDFTVEHNIEVTGIHGYQKSEIYPIGFVIGKNILSLREAQRLVYYGETQTAWRDVSWGTGFRTIVTLRDKNETIEEGQVWCENNPAN